MRQEGISAYATAVVKESVVCPRLYLKLATLRSLSQGDSSYTNASVGFLEWKDSNDAQYMVWLCSFDTIIGYEKMPLLSQQLATKILQYTTKSYVLKKHCLLPHGSRVGVQLERMKLTFSWIAYLFRFWVSRFTTLHAMKWFNCMWFIPVVFGFR